MVHISLSLNIALADAQEIIAVAEGAHEGGAVEPEELVPVGDSWPFLRLALSLSLSSFLNCKVCLKVRLST